MCLFSNQTIIFLSKILAFLYIYSIFLLLPFFFLEFDSYSYHRILLSYDRKNRCILWLSPSVTNNLVILTHLYFCAHNVLCYQIIYRDLKKS